jgi:hypothetical protein
MNSFHRSKKNNLSLWLWTSAGSDVKPQLRHGLWHWWMVKPTASLMYSEMSVQHSWNNNWQDGSNTVGKKLFLVTPGPKIPHANVRLNSNLHREMLACYFLNSVSASRQTRTWTNTHLLFLHTELPSVLWKTQYKWSEWTNYALMTEVNITLSVIHRASVFLMVDTRNIYHANFHSDRVRTVGYHCLC